MLRFAAVVGLIILSSGRADDLQGTIRIWGDDQMHGIVERWQKAFQKNHSAVQFETKLMGTGTGMAGLYTGVADIALMGRSATSKELMAFEWVFKYRPLEIAIMTGSLAGPGKSPALVVFVHRDNPISKLTLAQVGAIFSCDYPPGGHAVGKWGQLGLTGPWFDREIHAYGFDTETGSASFFKQVAMNGSGKWNWPSLREFRDASQILETLSRDPAGIAVANLCHTYPHVKPLALARDQSGGFYAPDRQNLIAQTYPLTRLVYAYVNRPLGKPVTAITKEFLEFILSEEGQAEVATEAGYLPLNASHLEEQRKKLQQ